MKNKNDNKLLEKIKNILLKKSEGYFYNEEVFEYQYKTENSANEKQLNFFDNDETKSIQESENLTLIKKKVTTHYVPPDLLAVKMLIETFGEKVNDDNLYNLSDTELNNLKQNIIKKLENL